MLLLEKKFFKHLNLLATLVCFTPFFAYFLCFLAEFFILILIFLNNVLLQDHIQEVLDKWDNIDDEIWAKESHSFAF